MPGNWTSIETNFPTFTGNESTEEQIQALQNYMFILTEQLKYNLSNLDMKNWNSKALEKFSKETTADVAKSVKEIAETVLKLGEAVSTLSNKVTGMADAVSDNSDKIADLEGALSGIEDAVSRLEAQQADMESELRDTQESISYMEDSVNEHEETINGQGGLQERMDTVEAVLVDFRKIYFSPTGAVPDMAEGEILLLPDDVNDS